MDAAFDPIAIVDQMKGSKLMESLGAQVLERPASTTTAMTQLPPSLVLLLSPLCCYLLCVAISLLLSLRSPLCCYLSLLLSLLRSPLSLRSPLCCYLLSVATSLFYSRAPCCFFRHLASATTTTMTLLPHHHHTISACPAVSFGSSLPFISSSLFLLLCSLLCSSRE